VSVWNVLLTGMAAVPLTMSLGLVSSISSTGLRRIRRRPHIPNS
jgi:hypothetical protein